MRTRVHLRWFLLASLAACLLSIALVARVAAQVTQAPQMDPSMVVEAFERARGAEDVDGAMALFTDSAVVTMEGRTNEAFTGQAQLRTYMQTIGTRFQIVMRSRPVVQGAIVTWTERDQFFGHILDATVIAVVSGGKIVSLTYRDNQLDAPRGQLAAPDQTRGIPAIVWPVGLVIVSGLLLGLTFGRPRRKASVSQLDGRLLLALQHQRVASLKKAA
jgi:hypothetical protein